MHPIPTITDAAREIMLRRDMTDFLFLKADEVVSVFHPDA
jgi:hypothetical protein